MKRLTKRLEDGQAVMDCDTCARSGSTCTVLACRNKLKDRICDYEDVMQSNGFVKQKHGRWEKAEYHGFLRCSECKDVYIDDTWVADGKWNYCPNCGAKMDGDGNA